MQHVLLIPLLLVSPLSATDDDIAFFDAKILPVLIQHCYEYPSATAKEIQGGLRVDSQSVIRTGDETGMAVVMEQRDNSLLMADVRHKSFKTPNKRRLTADTIRNFETWIHRGAGDMRDKPPTAR